MRTATMPTLCGHKYFDIPAGEKVPFGQRILDMTAVEQDVIRPKAVARLKRMDAAEARLEWQVMGWGLAVTALLGLGIYLLGM